MTTIDSPDIESLIAAGRKRHAEKKLWPIERNDPRASEDGYRHYCRTDGQPWPCPDRLLIDALVPVYDYARKMAHDLWGDWVEPDGPLTRKDEWERIAALAGRSVTPDGR